MQSHIPHRCLRLVMLFVVALFAVAAPAGAADGPATLVKDSNTAPYQEGFSATDPSGGPVAVDVNGTLFFTAKDDLHGTELWKSDGTSAGTLLLKDIQPGAGSSFLSTLRSINGKLLFVADDGSFGTELWVSDGTTTGTALLKDIFPGALSSVMMNLDIVVSGGRAFFIADDGSHGEELWVSDGTTTGTHLVKDLTADVRGSAPTNLIDVGGTLFFTTINAAGRASAIWKTDGSEIGTSLVKSSQFMVERLTAVGNRLFFWEFSTDTGLWVSDGTPAGTVKIRPWYSDTPQHALNGALIFFEISNNHGQIWTSNGTTAGTVMLAEFPEVGTHITDVVQIGGALYFLNTDSTNQVALWKTNGTTAGTVMLHQFTADTLMGRSVVRSLTDVQGTIFFLNEIFDTSQESLWKSDGTAAGTVLVKSMGTVSVQTRSHAISVAGRFVFHFCSDLCQIWSSDGSAEGTVQLTNAQSTVADTLIAAQGLGFFQTCDSNGCSMGKTNGTLAGTVVVKTAQPNTPPVMDNAQYIGGRIFFTDGATATALWVSDGTPAGTINLVSVPSDGWIGDLTPVGNRLFFVMGSPYALWMSDGTLAGTRPVKNAVTPSQMLSFANNLVFSSDGQLWSSDGTDAGTLPFANLPDNYLRLSPGRTQLFFTTCGTYGPCTLWRSDLTPAGTQKLRDFDPVFCEKMGCNADTMTVGDTAFFTLGQANYVAELWKSDGTVAGTVLLKEIMPRNVTAAGNRLFFSGDDGSHGSELWISDGTTAGTVLLNDINPGIAGSAPTNLTAAGNRLFFSADDGSHGSELWISDGTAAGTVLLTDIWPGPTSAAIQDLTVVGNRIFFSALDDTHGRELWISDGTSVGTSRVQDINPGPQGSLPGDLSEVNGQLFFSASDSVNGRELWVSDSIGTRLVQNIAPGVQSANPSMLIAADANLFLSANDGSTGPALWALPLTSQPFHPTRIAARTYIQAEDYDLGGDGLAYHDNSPANHNGDYRPNENVDLISTNSQTILAYTQPGEWLNYSVEIANTRAYTLEVALSAQGTGGSFNVMLDGVDVSGPITVPDTGGWDNWKTMTGPILNLPAGRHTLRLVFASANPTGYVANIDWFILDGSTVSIALPLVSR